MWIVIYAGMCVFGVWLLAAHYSSAGNWPDRLPQGTLGKELGGRKWTVTAAEHPSAVCVCVMVFILQLASLQPRPIVWPDLPFVHLEQARNYDAMWKFLVFTLRYFMGIWGVAVISAGFVRMLNGCRSESSLSSECNDTASLICPFSLWKPFKVPWSALRRATWRSGGCTVTIFTIICGCIEKYHKACFSLLTGRY